ncbi:MAG: sigma-70 family RNA polymerase sigma factor [Pseudomonadota bacterium]
MDATVSDQSLMLRYQAGDADAFEMLYARHRDSLFRFLRRQCESDAVAEELFQDVWLGLIRGRSNYKPDATFRTFVYRAARNRLIDHYRKSGRRGTLSAVVESDATEVVDEAPVGPEEVAIGEQALQQFSLALAALPEEQKTVFLMFKESGMSLAEVATTMEATIEATKSRLRYAVTKLRTALDGGQNDE